MAKSNKGLRTYEGQEGLNASLGQVGFKVLSATGTVVADIVGFHIISKTITPAVATMTTISKTGDSMAALPMETGTFIYGPFSSVTATFTSAELSVVVYYG
jgi:hypothetical protein